MLSKATPQLALSFLFLFCCHIANSQMITGTWKGKMNNEKVELKIIQQGDSIKGTSYYFQSLSTYRRYTIKGFFDSRTNEVVWWDDVLIEEKIKGISAPGKIPQLARADFNCPGGGRMLLDGTSGNYGDLTRGGPLFLEKTNRGTQFPDEWDFVIDNYTTGANHPDIIDSISMIALTERPQPVKETIVHTVPKQDEMVFIPPAREEISNPEIIEPKPEVKQQLPLTINEKFTNRKKIATKEIPLSGDSIELRMYDNAEIDGDSISLFLNGKLIYTNVRLSEKAFIIKLPVADLGDENELVMVAENLGAIPPNTSYLLAISGGNRYEAYLASTENSSAMIRLWKPIAASAGSAPK